MSRSVDYGSWLGIVSGEKAPVADGTLFLGIFGQLKPVVDLLRSTAAMATDLASKRARRQAVLELLRIYFLLLDVVTDGNVLLDSVGDDPARTLTNLDPPQADLKVREWQQIMGRQTRRLYGLSDALIGHDVLAVINPRLKDHLQEVISTKFEREDSLHAIGAGLVYYAMLGGTDRDWLLNAVRSQYPEQAENLIDVDRAREEIAALEQGLEDYRQVCHRLIKDEEIVALAKEARESTRL